MLTKLSFMIYYNQDEGREVRKMYEMIQALKNNDGLTLKNGKIISYKTGW